MVFLLFYKKKSKKTTIITEQNLTEITKEKKQIKNNECELILLDECGIKIMESWEINQIPARSHRLSSSDAALNRVRHLATDLFKGATGVPKKTVEIVS